MPSIRRLPPTLCLTVLILFAIPPVASLADQVDNPLYKAWSSFKVGSSATIGGTLQEGANSIAITTKYTLVELAADHAVIQKQDTITAMGQTSVNPPVNETLAATAGAQDVKITGHDDIQAMNRTFKCDLMQSNAPATSPSDHASPPAQLWVSGEVPGGIVKIDIQSRNDNGSPFHVMLVLQDFEAK